MKLWPPTGRALQTETRDGGARAPPTGPGGASPGPVFYLIGARLIPVKNFYDHGIPESLQEDPKNFPVLIAAYKAASQGKSQRLKPGDEVTLKKVDIAGEPHILAMTREITERKHAVEALRASEEQYRAIFNATADSLVLRDAEFRVVDVNPAYEKMSGRTREEALGRNDLTMSPPELNAHVRALHARAVAGEPVMFEALARRKNGERFDIETRGVPI